MKAPITLDNARGETQLQSVTGLQQTIAELREDRSRLERTVALYDEVASLVGRGAGLDVIVSALARWIGNPIVVDNRFFQTLARASPTVVAMRPPAAPRVGREGPAGDARSEARWALDRRLRRHVEALVARQEVARLPEVPEVGLDAPRLIAPVVGGGTLLGFVSIVAGERPLNSGDRRRARRAALIVGIELARRQAAFDAEISAAGDALRALLDAANLPDVLIAERAAFLGYDFTSPQYLLVVGVDSRADEAAGASAWFVDPRPGDLVALARDCGRRMGIATFVAERRGRVVILIDATSSDRVSTDGSLDGSIAGRFVDVLRRDVAMLFGATTVSVAVGARIEDLRDLRDAHDSAHDVLDLVAALGGRDLVIARDDSRLALFFLFHHRDAKALLAFVERILGPLDAYDAVHQSELVRSLEAFLSANGNVVATARALSVHASTLKYRLERITEIARIDLRDADHRLNAALALKLRTLRAVPSKWHA